MPSNGGESHLLCLDHIPPGATVVVAGMTVVVGRSCELIVFTDIDDVPLEPQMTEPATLTPSMEAEVSDWLNTIGGAWAQSQETKYGVPVDAWFAQIHRLTRLHSKRVGGFNTWNCYQKWWKHHHPEEERPLGSDHEGGLYNLSLLAAH